MKYFALVFSSILSLAAYAKQPPAPVYNMTGTATLWTAHHDSSVTVTSGGDTASVGCNISDTSVDCDDATGGLAVTLADGSGRVLGNSVFIVGGQYPASEFGMWTAASPLADQLHTADKNSEAFQYRLATFTVVGNVGTYLCVPTTASDKHDKQATAEACYTIH